MTAPARSDLTQLWQATVQDYENTTGKRLGLGRFGSMDEAAEDTEKLSRKFKDFRDDKSKVSKLRTAFKNNMWLIQNIINTVQNVGSAASVGLETVTTRKNTDYPNHLCFPGLSTGHACKFNIFRLWAGHAGTRCQRIIRSISVNKFSHSPMSPPTTTRSWDFSNSRTDSWTEFQSLTRKCQTCLSFNVASRACSQAS